MVHILVDSDKKKQKSRGLTILTIVEIVLIAVLCVLNVIGVKGLVKYDDYYELYIAAGQIRPDYLQSVPAGYAVSKLLESAGIELNPLF